MGMKILFETGLTGYNAADIEGVGTLRVDKYGNVYRWVENINSSTALVAGQPVNYDASVAAATRFQGVLATAAGDQEMLAGVAMSAIPAGEYGWIQCKGMNAIARVEATSSVIVIGDVLGIASTKLAFTHTTAGGNAPRNDPCVAWEAYSATSTSIVAKDIMLNCAV